MLPFLNHFQNNGTSEGGDAPVREGKWAVTLSLMLLIYFLLSVSYHIHLFVIFSNYFLFVL